MPRITEEALLRRRCDDADGLLRQYAAEGAALAEEANEAARRNRVLETFASDAFALVEGARALVDRRRRERAAT